MSTTIGRRIVQYSYGDPRTVLTVETGIAPTVPRPGEVLVHVPRSMIHPGDLQLVAARHTTPGVAIPEGRVPGLEVAGVIADAAAGDADAVAFGAPYLANPDLVERLRDGLPLAPVPPRETWYGGGAKGYTDHPRASNGRGSGGPAPTVRRCLPKGSACGASLTAERQRKSRACVG